MDVILKVLEGGKTGTKIAVKKNEFIIGRSTKCHLCAGSTAISRQHCAILRDDNRVTVKDLGSRNGTLLNGVRIDGEHELVTGDELIVGPLKFMVAITPGITNAKRPEVKSVAEAVVRAADTPSGDIGDDDISKWLLGPTSALTDTQTIRLDDTNAIQSMQKQLAKEAEAAAKAAEADATTAGSTPEADVEKTAPGKLPKLPPKPSSKDSREAAADALRAWSRRR